MKIAIVAPSPIPFTAGGAEKMWWGLMREINTNTSHQADLVKLPTREHSFWDLIDSYEAFSRLDVSGFDLVISGKYPAWMISHPRHLCYMQHPLRGLYDCFHFTKLPLRYGKSTHKGLRRFQRLLRTQSPVRESLPDVFGLLRELRLQGDLPADAQQFPGSFIRELIHYLDAVALGPREIEHYYAISRTVANRHLYFPPDTNVDVLYPPSNLQGFRCADFNYLFTASRLDNPKRIALLIEAMRFVNANIELRIAGEGPDAQKLTEQSKGDPRIVFLGYRSDTELLDDYANALAVTFVPYDEDYGLVTIEAMMSGKPVLTVSDSGGPTEFVRHKITGLCVSPDPRQIGEAIQWLATHQGLGASMGENARRRVQSITWPNVTHALFAEPWPTQLASRSRGRRTLTVATTFGVTPVQAGGQLRIFNLYKNLISKFDTELVSLGRVSDQLFSRVIAPGLREVRIPKTLEHEEAETEISREVEWFPVTDVALPQLFHLTPGYTDALQESSARADIIVACHPYSLPALEYVSDKPLWYEAQDVEYTLKQSLIPKTERGLQLVEQVRDVERRCCERAEIVMACSEIDRDALVSLYNLPAAKMRVVPNGVDTRKVRFTSRERSLKTKDALGLADCFSAVFIGSWHPPNLEAIKAIMNMATKCPEVRFLILGSSCLFFERQPRPDNVGLFGVVDDFVKDLVLRSADLALNPIEQGSGTNLKMLEYAAAGVPIVTTALGMRGLGFQHLRDVFVEDIGDFPERIASTRRAPPTTLQGMAEHARQHVRKYFDWRYIGRRLLESL
jgi:glycosyltransferase involved in cell wall biosynthesis